ncbi:MAG: hypothetical protein QM479_08395 [Pseudomonadota bacterium]
MESSHTAQTSDTSELNDDKKTISRASTAAAASLLNLTLLPVLGFIWLLLIKSRTTKNNIDYYHVMLGIKINLIAAATLFSVSALIILSGGLDSVYTWIYVILYFTLVHTLFILTATISMIKAWSGKKLRE